MKCPYCGAESKVIDVVKDVDRVIRRRRCESTDCNSRFYTEETDVSIQRGKELMNALKREKKK